MVREIESLQRRFGVLQEDAGVVDQNVERAGLRRRPLPGARFPYP